ncbi:Xaa-Pro peptidase family protein [Sporosarcina oncorhynchi]|uniref:Xaa-Pro peptidase family protein n=1 Tax=Sporosarcina oncorhynchi TaxID=3056444 RepID=A0ABZ0L676_9BACL|nr:Xaa-Pro peptidase family protein [Sporosarcina sp. T2O-4]WOV88066.1 Xaa-Pro peptidase family protein [Sporosarcina sp. T2O-4]
MKGSNAKVVREKLEQATQLMKKHEIDTWLVLTREGSDPALPLLVGVRSVHQAAIFIRESGKHIVLTSKSDAGSYESTNLFDEVRVYESSMEKAFTELWNELSVEKLALNISEQDHLCDGLTYGLYSWLKDNVGEQILHEREISSEEMLGELRSIKTEAEIATVAEAVRITVEIFESVHSKLKPFMTEIEIGNLFVEEMKERGVSSGLGDAYDPPLVCAVRHGLAHRKPSDRLVEPGDIVIIDFSMKYEDYVSDIARTFYFLKDGEQEAPATVNHAFETAYKAITESIEALLVDKKGYEVDAVGRKVIEEAGYPTIRHSVGHQIGRATHDGGTTLGPRRVPVRLAVEGSLKAGEIYAIEPTVIQDKGLPCMLVEENVLVTEEGPVLLSKRQDTLWLVKR